MNIYTYIYIYYTNIYVIYTYIQYINIPGLVIHNGSTGTYYISQRSALLFRHPAPSGTQDPGKSSMNTMHSLSVLHSYGLQSPLLLLDLMHPGWMNGSW